jgi:hypothetical protein
MFVKCSTRTATVCWASIVGTVALVLSLCAWLLLHTGAIGACWSVPMSLVVGYFLADLVSGVVHWGLDTWFDETSRIDRAVRIAREHHSHPSHILGYNFRDYAGFSSLPALLSVGPVAVALVLAGGGSTLAFHGVVICVVILVGLLFGSHTHALGHRKSNSRVVRALQRMHLLLSPEHHGVHHSGGHDIRYCAVSGWANYFCDAVGFWRELEHFVVRLTGAEPRAHDLQWMRMYAPARYARRVG